MSGWSRNLTVLLTLLVVSIAIIGADWLIASNDESWDDVGVVLYNVVALVGVVGILVSLFFLVARYRNSVRQWPGRSHWIGCRQLRPVLLTPDA